MVLLPNFLSTSFSSGLVVWISLLALHLFLEVCVDYHQEVMIFSSGLLLFVAHCLLTGYIFQWLHLQNGLFQVWRLWIFHELWRQKVNIVQNIPIQWTYPCTGKPIPCQINTVYLHKCFIHKTCYIMPTYSRLDSFSSMTLEVYWNLLLSLNLWIQHLKWINEDMD